ncbi:hypothetical protein MSG28_007581 [Choristoneura fumiferana]|uniref:Uncharacterized protein n=1 Tax=Choristoneura fumiferana TaxID=7141 RepID=A0ACC0JXV0_CHOFU|nr:hypothetical protein MSG28_007581 [Choristoneura fumiferana]
MSDIMSVQDVINSAFGDETQNTVNFRMLKAVLLILGNQLRILQRHVAVSMWDRETGSAPKVTVSEVKIHTSGKKRRTSKRSKDDPRACIPEGAVICEAPPIDIEEQRERELRTIEQRADSYEEPATTPSPMASAPSLSKDRLLIGVNLKDFRDLAKDYGVEVPHEIEIIELKRESPESVLEEEPKDCVTYEELELITSFQDHLAQMQFDLETGLENLSEALANASTDPEDSHVCRRYCGGSHTMIPTVPRATQGITITRLPNEVSATVGADGKDQSTKPIPLQRGVRQGDVISPKLFTAGLEDDFKVLDWKGRGINNNGEYFTHLRFADDIVVMAETMEDLSAMLTDLSRVISDRVSLK